MGGGFRFGFLTHRDEESLFRGPFLFKKWLSNPWTIGGFSIETDG